MSTALKGMAQQLRNSSAGETLTNADVLLQALEEAGVDYVFATRPGAEDTSVIESYQKRVRSGKNTPELLAFQDASIAISAADGYARTTGHIQCVLSLGKGGSVALTQGLNKASKGRVPLLVVAGEAALPSGAPALSSRYSRRLAAKEDLKAALKRAQLFATTGVSGPVVLTLPTDLLAEAVPVESKDLKRAATFCHLGVLPTEDVKMLGDALLEAKAPLVITGYLGRKPGAVDALIKLADLVKGLQVFDAEFRTMSFPANHPATVTRRSGAQEAVQQADLILVLDADKPWTPEEATPQRTARIFHIDCDPRKENVHGFDIGAESTWMADCEHAIQDICAYVESTGKLSNPLEEYDKRWQTLLHKHVERLEHFSTLAAPRPDDSISADMLFAALRWNLPAGTIYVSDITKHNAAWSEQLHLTTTGTNVTQAGSASGWALGASVGIQLACRHYHFTDRPSPRRLGPEASSEHDKLVCCVTEDESLLRSNPVAGFLSATRLGTPFLTVVVNQGGWKATRSYAEESGPGQAAVEEGTTGRPDYVAIAKAASGNKIWGCRVDIGSEIDDALREAARVVLEDKRGAIVDVLVN